MPTYEVLITGEFSAAHQLRLPDGSLEPLHGHNWKVEVYLTGPRLDEMGVLIDFVPTRAELQRILSGLHDRYLNDLPAFASCNPSAELVARHVHDALLPSLGIAVTISMVRVWEAIGCAAAYVADS